MKRISLNENILSLKGKTYPGSDMEILLLFPPQWTPIDPYLSLPTLLGQLRKEGYKSEAIDLNIEFYNDILKKSYINESIKKASKIREEISEEAEKYISEEKDINNYPFNIKELILKYKSINNFFENKSDLLKTVPNEIEKSVSNIKDPNKFYNPVIFKKSYKTILSGLELASLPYAPSKVTFYDYQTPTLTYEYESIKHQVLSNSTNIFIEYFSKWIPKLKRKNAKCIGISISSTNQLIAGLTLAYLLKKNTTSHITIGGNYFSRIVDDLVKFPDFFDMFCDSLIIDEGEKPILELIKYINNQAEIEDVPNLIYKKDNEIIINKSCISLNQDETAPPDFSDIKFSKYFTPKTVLPVQSTRGCYWGKCTFCDIPYGKKYSVKNIDNLIKEFKTYKKKFNIDHFFFVDEAIHPTYLEEMAEKLIKEKIKITYSCQMRTENMLTEEILRKAHDSGFKMALWGLESGSERILKLINKGIEENRLQVLEKSAETGIWNHAFTFFGFPSEKATEARLTISMIEKNTEIIDSYSMGAFALTKHSKILKNLEAFGITKIYNDKNLLTTSLRYESLGMNKEGKEKLLYYQKKFFSTKDSKNFWKHCSCSQYLFLYVSKYGREWVKNYKF